MKKWLYALAFLFAFAMIAPGFSVMQTQQSIMPGFHKDNITGSVTALNVTNFQGPPVDLELITHVKFLILRTDSNIFPTGKIYVNGQFAINVTEPTLHILELSVIANRFYRFQIIFNNGTYSPFFLNATINGRTYVPVVLQSQQNATNNFQILGTELNGQNLAVILSFLILMAALVIIPRRYLGRN